jgi:hypothetical protein
MSHTYHAAAHSLWLRLEWQLLVRIERWAFSHRRRGLLLREIVTLVDRTYNCQRHG